MPSLIKISKALNLISATDFLIDWIPLDSLVPIIYKIVFGVTSHSSEKGLK